jgi:hypothetical protein
MTTGKIYKFDNEIKQILKKGCSCPPINAVEQDLDAYRWCADPISVQCFSPQAQRNPPRLLKATDPEEQCSCWGLSMHTNLNASQSAFQTLEKSFRGIRKIFGGYVASGKLTPQHGLVTPPDKHGHFDLHEYKDTMIIPAFQLDSEIPRL